MHIAEGILPPLHAAAWYIAAAPFVAHGARRVIADVKAHPENRILLAAAGAFAFVLSAIKLPSVTGSSSHATGTGAGAILFRPPIMAFLGAVVLLFQALLLAHGGLTTLGANVFSFGIVGPWVAYGVFVLNRKLGSPPMVGIFLAMALGNLLTYVVTSFQLAIAIPDPALGFIGSLGKFMGIFALTQIPLSIMEGILGVLLFGYLFKVAAPQMRRLGVMPAEKKEAANV